MSRRSLVFLTAFTILSTYSVYQVIAKKSGISGYSKSGCGGGECHTTTKSTATTVKVWTDSTQLFVGHSYQFHISVINATSKAIAGGCDISADNNADLDISGSGLKLLSSELTHESPALKDGDSIVWTFLYTPTKPGLSHIYAAGNAVNLNEHTDGDQWNTTVFTTTVTVAGPNLNLTSPLRDTALVGGTDAATVWLHNYGTASLTIDHYGLKTGSVWSITDSTPRSIAVGDSAPIGLAFTPTAFGTITDTLHIWSNDAAQPMASVALIGLAKAGKLTLDSTKLTFSKLAIGSTSVRFGKITNVGNSPLSIQSISVSSPSGAFKFVNFAKNAKTPITLGTSSSTKATTDTFAFTPIKAGLDSAFVTIQFSEVASQQDTTIVLIGEGFGSSSVEQSTNALHNIAISPNPSQGHFSIHSDLTIPIAQIAIMDVNGKILLQSEVTSMQEMSLDGSELPNGTYWLRVSTKNGEVSTGRLVIER